MTTAAPDGPPRTGVDVAAALRGPRTAGLGTSLGARGRRRASGLSVKAASTVDALEIWPSLERPGDSAHYVFQLADVIKVWCATIGAARRVQNVFLRVDADGEPLMLIGFGIERRSGARVLTFLDGGVSDYNAPVLFAAAARRTLPAAELWDALTEALPAFDAVMLEKMPSHVCGRPNPLFPLAAQAAAPSGHVIPLHGAWPDYVAARLHRPKDSRRKRRRLAEAGAMRFIVAKTATDVQRLFPAFVEQKTRRYLELNGADGFERPGYRAYFSALTQALHERGLVHLSALEVGGEILATHWGLVWGKRFYCLMLAFAEHALARYSPARLLIEHLIEWSYAHGIETFDLGYGDAVWKSRVGPERLPLAHATFPATPFGWTYLEARKLRDALLSSRPTRSEQVA